MRSPAGRIHASGRGRRLRARAHLRGATRAARRRRDVGRRLESHRPRRRGQYFRRLRLAHGRQRWAGIPAHRHGDVLLLQRHRRSGSRGFVRAAATAIGQDIARGRHAARAIGHVRETRRSGESAAPKDMLRTATAYRDVCCACKRSHRASGRFADVVSEPAFGHKLSAAAVGLTTPAASSSASGRRRPRSSPRRCSWRHSTRTRAPIGRG